MRTHNEDRIMIEIIWWLVCWRLWQHNKYPRGCCHQIFAFGIHRLNNSKCVHKNNYSLPKLRFGSKKIRKATISIDLFKLLLIDSFVSFYFIILLIFIKCLFFKVTLLLHWTDNKTSTNQKSIIEIVDLEGKCIKK